MSTYTITDEQIKALSTQIVCEYERAKTAYNIELKPGRADETCFEFIIKEFLNGHIYYPEAHQINHSNIALPHQQ